MSNHAPRIIPASAFGIVLGLAGLANAWRPAHRVWQVSALPGEALFAAAAFVWVLLVVSYVHKWISRRAEALAEARQPIQCCFIGLIGVCAMLLGGGLLPYSRMLAEIVFAIGLAYTVAFAVWRTGGLWTGERDIATATPVLYLPTVAGSFVAAANASAFGHADWGQFLFGAGFFSWLAIESVLLNRLYHAPGLALPLRPALGIQLAPAAVGAVAYVSVTSGPPDLLAHALLGYGLLQALVLLRMLPWIRKQAFAASYWGFSFGASALCTSPLRMMERGDTGPVVMLAPVLFIAANIVIGPARRIHVARAVSRHVVRVSACRSPAACRAGGAVSSRAIGVRLRRCRSRLRCMVFR